MKRIRRKDESVRASNSIKWSTLVVVQHGEKKNIRNIAMYILCLLNSIEKLNKKIIISYKYNL